MAFGFFFAAMAVVKLMDRKARKTGKYRPEIIKVKRKARLGDIGNADFDSLAEPCSVPERHQAHP